MEDKITIIEGPSPTFEVIPDLWVKGLAEGHLQSEVVATRLRTFDGEALVERCRQAWKKQQPIYLEFRNYEGLQDEVPIVAARNQPTEEGDMLILWVRFPQKDVEMSIEYDDEDDDFYFDDFDDFEDDDPF